MNEDITIDVSDIENFDMEALPDVEIFNDLMANGGMEILGGIIIGFMILGLISHLLSAWGLWNINKKLSEKHAWLSWIPMLQIYSIYRASGKKVKSLYLLIAFIILAMIPILGFVFIIAYIYIYIVMVNGISKRLGRGGWTTVGFIMLPFIMLPLVGSSFKPEDEVKSVIERDDEGVSDENTKKPDYSSQEQTEEL